MLQANRKRRGKSSRRAGGETDSRGKRSGGRHEGPGRRGPASGSGNAENTAWKEIPLSWVVRGRQESHLVDQQVPTALFCTACCCYLSPNPLRESFWSNPPMISLFIPRLQYQNCPRWRSQLYSCIPGIHMDGCATAGHGVLKCPLTSNNFQHGGSMSCPYACLYSCAATSIPQGKQRTVCRTPLRLGRELRVSRGRLSSHLLPARARLLQLLPRLQHDRRGPNEVSEAPRRSGRSCGNGGSFNRRGYRYTARSRKR